MNLSRRALMPHILGLGLIACLLPASAGAGEARRIYFNFSLKGTESVLLDGAVPGGASDLVNPDTTRFWLGWEASIDFRLGSRFGLGVYVNYLEPEEGFGDLARVMGGLRLLGLIELGEQLVLVPYGRLGFNSSHLLQCPAYAECDPRFGYAVGGGFGVRWMFLGWLGLAANLDLGIRSLYWHDDQDRLVDVSHFDIGFDLGLTAGF
jgi:hypothetical protein